MKKIFVLLLFACSLVQLQAQALFDKLSREKDVSTVYVSKALLSMMPKIGSADTDIKSISNKLTQIEIYTTKSGKAIKLIQAEMKSLYNNRHYERIMQVKENGENVIFFAEQQGNNFKDLIMFVESSQEYTVIRLMGTFTPDDIQKVTNKK